MTQGADLAGLDLRGADLSGAADLGTGAPTDIDCFYGWKTLGKCPAPEISASYLSTGCRGTTGVFVVGSHFQSGNQFDSTNGWMPHGPYALPDKLNRETWNWVTPRALCITTSADTAYWTGFTMQVRNPDGQVSSSVTVSNQLVRRPPLPSSGSSDPFDLNACDDAGLSMTDAQARFAPGATTATLGSLPIWRRSRPCTTATGCGPWGAATIEATYTAKLQIVVGSVHFAIDAIDCGMLGQAEDIISINDCITVPPDERYRVHVAGSCLMLWKTARSTVAGDGSYTQTDYNAVLRY